MEAVMFCFVSSWYSCNEKWHANESPWYRPGDAYEFDDTINQIRMFHAAGELVQLMSLAYAPGLRMFLHRQNLYPMDVWNLYDEMQGIAVRKLGVVSWQSLDWPRNLQWRYTPFAMIGFLGMERYAELSFGENGNLIRADYYSHEMVRRRDLYDDRGFRSSSIYCDESGNEQQEYCNEDGTPQFLENKESGHVAILPAASGRFRRKSYASVDQMIEETLRRHFLDMDPETTVVVAANQVHNQMILRARKGQSIGFSYFENRFDLKNAEALKRDLAGARFAVTDTEHSAGIIREETGAAMQIYDISPFDTRLSLGKSQRIRELKIFMPVDGLEGFLLETAMTQVFSYMEKNRRVILQAVVQTVQEDRQRGLARELESILDKNGITDLGVCLEKEAGEAAAENGKARENRVQIISYQTENDLIRRLYDVRLILDVRDQPDLYLQIAGISAGIPQVNYRFTRYVQHQKDGYIIQNIHYITGALEYYLSELVHWNEALVYCVKEIEKYTGGSLVQQWKLAVEDEAEENGKTFSEESGEHHAG